MSRLSLRKQHGPLGRAEWRLRRKCILKYYANAADVIAALEDGSHDAMMGSGILTGAHVVDFMYNHTDTVTVHLTEAVIHLNIAINANKSPTNDLQTRKIIIHGINKTAIIEKVLAGIDEPAGTLFPKEAP